MKIIHINATRGPNYWSIKRPNLIVMELDLEDFEYRPTHMIDGFYKRIQHVLPGLYDHWCSEGAPGGFLNRVKRGTWMGHVIEHIALELQVQAGLEVGFGRTRGTGTEGQYHVVFDYVDEESGRLAAEKAVSVAQDLADGFTKSIDSAVSEIREMNALYRPGPSTSSILREARARNIPFIKLPQSSTYQLGYGRLQKKIAATITSTTSNMAVDIACDKEACRRLFKSMQIPIAEGRTVYSPQELRELIEEMGFPLVIKPTSGNQGRGVTTDIQNVEAALKAFESATEISDAIVVEREISGHDFRLLTVNYKLIAAAKRTPAHVTGDGKSTIKELVAAVNNDPERGDGHDKALTKIEIGPSTKTILKNKGYTLSTVLPANELLYLDHAANLSKGGTAEDVTDLVHPRVATMAERISKVVGLDICGIDIMASTLDQPLYDTGGVVLEVNAAPGFRMHLSPSTGKARNVAAPVVDMLFPTGAQSRIPLIAITGTNGKTTTSRLISHIMKTAGHTVGLTTTDGIYVDEQLMMTGDCGGPKSAEFILQDPTVDSAVLECARGGILRSGLGFDQCDAAVVTNVCSDHLGMRGIDSLDKLARVKSVVPESVHPAGYAILNADDERVYAMRNNVRGNIVLFSMDPDNKRIQDHAKDGGLSAIYQDRHIVIKEGTTSRVIEKIDNVPLSFGGRAEFMIENVLAAVAAAYSQKIAPDNIRAALNSFVPSADQTPGRMNTFDFPNFDVILDYAHNPAGLFAVKKFLDHSSYKERVGIIAGIGDRRMQDNLEMGRLAAEIFDKIIIREDSDLRGKAPGESTELIKQGISSSDHSPSVTAIADEKEALLFALNNAETGSVIILCAEKINAMLSFIKRQKNRSIKRKWTKRKKHRKFLNLPPGVSLP